MQQLLATPVRIQSPLVKLRGLVRRYVTIEGCLTIALFIVTWFWIGLALDYGSFKLAAFDWVQELPRWFRGGLLAVLSAIITSLTIMQIVRRLRVDLRPDALALVLEKKFPDVLGDRLITAVELSDLQRAAAQGYSPSMIADTVRQAESLVVDLPVHSVFDWQRLRQMGLQLTCVTLLPLLVVGIAYTAYRKTNPLVDYLPRMGEIATIWTRRNILLSDITWPRKAYLDVLDFPASGEMRVGRDSSSMRLRLKARHWVIADSAAADGWRSMLWSDLRPGLIGSSPPELPAALAGQQSPPTLDQIEIALDNETLKKQLQPEALDSIRGVFTTLAQGANEHRSLYRRLELPEKVEVKYWGGQTSSRIELLRGPGWEYAGPIADLKESVKFWARGADFYTTTRSIVLVPPPAIQQLKKIEYRPAYLYHRPPVGNPPDGGALALKGLKQKVEDLVSLNGPTSKISLPAGTDLVLEGLLDKELASVLAKPRGKDADGMSTPLTLAIAENRLGFHHRFDHIVAPLDFELEFTDTDGVKSTRHITVDPFVDPPPLVNVAIDGIRRNNKGLYLLTPIALIPMEGKINDGPAGALGGLDRIEYQVTWTRLESAPLSATHAAYLAAAMLPAANGQADGALVNGVASTITMEILRAIAPANVERTVAMETFQQQLRERGSDDLPRAKLLPLLQSPPASSRHVREFFVQPRFEGLDLRERIPELKVSGDLDVQPRYRMIVSIVATDNNIETGPGIGVNKEPPFQIQVVSETELLVEIARDEEAQHLKTEDAISRLNELRLKLTKVAEEAATPDAVWPTLAQRAVETVESAGKARDLVQEVYTEYNRILRELNLNRVALKFIEKVKGEICLPLESCLKGEFVAAEQSLESVQKELEGSRRPTPELFTKTNQQLDALIAKLNQIMTAMGEVTTLNKLIESLREIEKGQEQVIAMRLKELKRLQREKLIRDLDKIKGLEDK